jgi:hypothetical protein
MQSATPVYPQYPLNQRVGRELVADLRLQYGIAVPMFATIGFIVALAVSGQSWMVGPVVVLLLVTVAAIVFGLLGVLDAHEDQI